MKKLLLLALLLTVGCQKTYYIDRVNKSVNQTIEYKDDPEEIWQSPHMTKELGTGDCEDFAILKAYKLQDYNPVLVIVQTETVQHALLRVEMEGKYYYLDNRYDFVLTETEYRLYYPWELIKLDWRSYETRTKGRIRSIQQLRQEGLVVP